MEESFSGCSHPANTAMLRPRQALRGVLCPFWSCSSVIRRRDGRTTWGPAFVPWVIKLLSACVPVSQLVSGNPGLKWGRAPRGGSWLLWEMHHFQERARMVIHTALSGHLPQGEPDPGLTCRLPALTRPVRPEPCSLELLCSAPDWGLHFNHKEDSPWPCGSVLGWGAGPCAYERRTGRGVCTVVPHKA